jgi:hypothetical protein
MTMVVAVPGQSVVQFHRDGCADKLGGDWADVMGLGPEQYRRQGATYIQLPQPHGPDDEGVP